MHHGSAVIAWLSTYWKWYWDTFSWAGLGIAFLASFMVLAIGALVIALAAWVLTNRQAPNLKPVLVPDAAPRQAPVQQVAARPLSAYEAEHKIKAIDLCVAILRDRIAPEIRYGERFSGAAIGAFRDTKRLHQLDEEYAQHVNAVRQNNLLLADLPQCHREYEDITSLMRQPDNASLSMALEHLRDTLFLLVSSLKDDVPREAFLKLIGPRLVVIQETVRNLAHWRNHAEEQLIAMRKKLAP